MRARPLEHWVEDGGASPEASGAAGLSPLVQPRARALMLGRLAALLPLTGRRRTQPPAIGQAEEPLEEVAPARVAMARPFTPLEGHAFRTVPEGRLAGRSDSSPAPRASRLVVYEDGEPLGPRHSPLALVVSEGAGRYAHFLDQLDFSSSDNSDPNTNGRDYSFAIGEPSPVTLGLGGCHMNALVRSIHQRGLIDLRGVDIGAGYSPLEQLRVVQRQLGLLQEPDDIAPLAVSTLPTARSLLTPGESIDLLLIETTAHTNALLGDACLNRAQLMQELIGPAQALGREMHEAVSRWYGQGILKCDDATREAAARDILAGIDGTALDRPHNRLALEGARGVRETPQQMQAHLSEICTLVKAQRTVLIRGPNMFLPDGRGISWGANLLDELRAVARGMGAPLIDIGELVLEKGFAFSVLPDMHHHTDAFIDHLGEVVIGEVQRAYGPWPAPDAEAPASS